MLKQRVSKCGRGGKKWRRRINKRSLATTVPPRYFPPVRVVLGRNFKLGPKSLFDLRPHSPLLAVRDESNYFGVVCVYRQTGFIVESGDSLRLSFSSAFDCLIRSFLDFSSLYFEG